MMAKNLHILLNVNSLIAKRYLLEIMRAVGEKLVRNSILWIFF